MYSVHMKNMYLAKYLKRQRFLHRVKVAKAAVVVEFNIIRLFCETVINNLRVECIPKGLCNTNDSS